MTVRGLWLVACGVVAAFGQQTVAPTQAPVGSPRGENAGGYNVLNSFELGWRFADVHGDSDKYRSDVNFGNGVRLLANDLRVNSRDGHGPLFDELLIRTQGLGNDPYQFASLRVEKNRWYRYDFAWRLNDYVNAGFPLARGLHRMNTERRLQDHDIVFLPQSSVRLFAGYSRNAQDGPALSTVALFQPLGDEFPLLADVRRLQNVYRVGGELRAAGARLTIQHGWTRFSETTPFRIAGSEPGQNPADTVVLDSFRRSEPYRGSSPFWNVNLFREASLWFVNGRFTYAGGERSFFFDELLAGTNRFGAAQNRQILVGGNARRPVSTANLVLSLFPGDSLTLSNQFAFHNTRMNGDNTYRELNNATLLGPILNFQELGIRTISNLADVTYRPAARIGLYGGYRFSTRRIDSAEQSAIGAATDLTRASQENTMHAGLVGLRLMPVKPLALSFDAEIGRADRPFFPISRRNYHLLGARAQYRTRTVMLSAAARSNYNNNSVVLTSHSSRSRDYALSASWSPPGRFGFDASYSKIHLDTLSGIAYFAAGSFIQGDQSLYISNLHTGTALVRFSPVSRVDLAAGYTRVQDTARGRAGVPVSLGIFADAQTFPLTYEAPLARASVRLHAKLRLNAGYQFYHYDPRSGGQNYRAHTGYTSLLWSF